MERKADGIMVGIDWGFSHPMAMVRIARLGERYVIVEDYNQKNIIINIKWLFSDFYAFARNAKIAVCDNARPELIQYCDSGYKDDTMERISTRFEGCNKYPGSVDNEIATINRLFSQDRILINEKCKQTIIELESWTKKENKEKPNDLDEDTLRAIGYAIMSIEQSGGMLNVF